MCHQFTCPSLNEINAYLHALQLPLSAPTAPQTVETYEVFPKRKAPVLRYDDHKLQLVWKKWGFIHPYSPKKVLFNARIERFYEAKPSLWDTAFAQKRCLILAKAFYEIKGQQTFRFQTQGHELTLIAGIYQEDHFAMVTTQPNQTMAPIHDRMPLVIAPEELRRWLFQNFTSLIDRSQFKLSVKLLPPQA